MISRRRFCTGFGLGAAAMPVVAGRFAKPARAAETGFPTRLVIVVMPNGVRHETFWPTGDNASLVIDPGANSSLAPLKPFEKKLLVVGGLSLQNMYDADSMWAHSSTPFVLTAAPGAPFEGAWDDMMKTGGAPSVDLHVAAGLRAAGVKTKFPSLVMRVGAYRGNDGYLSIAGKPIANKVNAPTPVSDPRQLFTSLFGDLDLSADTRTRAAALDRSVLDHVGRRLAALKSRVGSAEAQHLESHLTAVRDIEQRLRGTDATAVCTAPTAPAAYQQGETRYLGKVARLFSDLTVAALRCDLTRVACVGWTGDSWPFTFPKDSEAEVLNGSTAGPYKDEHGIAHDVTEGAEAARQKTLVDRWFAREFAHLLTTMDAVREGDGTLLDHSIVVLANQMSDGYWHSAADIPWIVAGTGNGKVRTGRLIRYAAGSAKKSFKPHSGLLRDLSEAMGVDSAGLQSGPYGGPYGVLG